MRHARLFALLAATVALGHAPLGWAQGPASFVARVDRTSTELGDPIVYEVTLSMPDGRAEGYKAPDFRGFRVLGEYPSQSTQIQMGGGSSVMRTVYTWRYELSPSESGRLTINPARVRVRGKELRTAPVVITVAAGDIRPPGSAATADPRRTRQRPQRRVPRTGSPFDNLFGGAPDPFEPLQVPPPAPEQARGRGNFLQRGAGQAPGGGRRAGGRQLVPVSGRGHRRVPAGGRAAHGRLLDRRSAGASTRRQCGHPGTDARGPPVQGGAADAQGAVPLADGDAHGDAAGVGNLAGRLLRPPGAHAAAEGRDRRPAGRRPAGRGAARRLRPGGGGPAGAGGKAGSAAGRGGRRRDRDLDHQRAGQSAQAGAAEAATTRRVSQLRPEGGCAADGQ